MKKVFVFLLIFVNILFAEEKFSKVYLKLEYSGKTEVFIDCNHNNNGLVYNKKKFTNDVALNDTFYEYCKNGADFKIDSLENFRKMYKENTSGSRTTDMYPGLKILKVKNGETFDINYLNKYINTFVLVINSFNHSSGVFSLNIIPITFIENVKIEKQTYLGIIPLENKQVKSYKINNLVFDNKLKSFSPRYNLNEDVIFKSILYTNSYKIDDNNECVEGYLLKDKIQTSSVCQFIVKPPLPVINPKEIKKDKKIKKVIKKEKKDTIK